MSVAAELRHLDLDRLPPFYRLVVEADIALRGHPTKRTRWLLPGQQPTIIPYVGPDRRRDGSHVARSRVVAKSEYPDPPGEWVKDAACKGRKMYYELNNAHVNKVSEDERKWEKRALMLCRACPVVTECRTWAMQDIDPAVDHIAGGLTPRQRRDIRRGLA